CDAALTLMHMGFRGKLIAISRRGLLPQPHGPSDAATLAGWAERVSAASLATLLREIRTKADLYDWRSVIDALRGPSGAIWRSMSLHDQDRFVKRLAPYWDAHRHRLP